MKEVECWEGRNESGSECTKAAEPLHRSLNTGSTKTRDDQGCKKSEKNQRAGK